MPMRLAVCMIAVVLALAGCQRTPPAVERNRELNRALRALDDGDTDKALEHIDAALAIDRDAAHLHQVKGSILFQAGRYGDAILAYDRALHLNDRSAEAELGAGLSLAMLGRDRDAEQRYKRAEAIYINRASNPPSAQDVSQERIDAAVIDARLHLALIAALRGQDAAAVGQVDRLEAAYPDWEEADRWRQVIEAGELAQLLTGNR